MAGGTVNLTQRAPRSQVGAWLRDLTVRDSNSRGLSFIPAIAGGGSMFPRFAMSETLQTVGLLTFNAWALDGYQKVFWRDAPVWELWPQVLVLGGLTIVFLSAARSLARRWEAI